MKEKAIVVAATILLLMFSACNQGPDTPAGLSPEATTSITAFPEHDTTTQSMSMATYPAETVITAPAETESTRSES